MTCFRKPLLALSGRATCRLFIAASAIGLALVTEGCGSAPTRSQANNRDHLTGWFRRSESDTLIPVFQRDGTYYSVCRGVEVPLRPCAEGLEWALTPSSMTGTKIGWDAVSSTYYLAVKDQQAYHFTDGRSGGGDKEPMARVAAPSGLPEAKARRPRTLDDFLGWYQPIWFPGLGFEIRKDGDRYVSQDHECRGPAPGSWQKRLEPRELTTLPDQLGFTGFDRGSGTRLVYDDGLERFEIVMTDAKRTPSVIRMPLARLLPLSSPGSRVAASPTVRIGIPSWH